MMLLKDACPSHHALDKQHDADQGVLFLVLTLQAYELKVWGFVGIVFGCGWPHSGRPWVKKL